MLSSKLVISFLDALKNSTTNQRPAREERLWPIWDTETGYFECAHGIRWPDEDCSDCTHCPQCDFAFGGVSGHVLLACPECEWYREGWRDVSRWADEVYREFGTDPNENDLWEAWPDIEFVEEEEPWLPEE